MNFKLIQLGSHAAIAFAADELQRYLSRMDRTSRISRILSDRYNAASAGALYIGIDPAFDGLLPKADDPNRDDGIYINVTNGAGIITGTNPRSVLIAVYRFLRALGCAFLRPGADGEIIPHRLPDAVSVYISEAASYRHRTVCIEGAVSYEHVADMIDFLPKIAMNGYFVQFKKPYVFFERWYGHPFNPNMPAEPMTDAEMDGMYDMLRGEISKRGLIYHAVGHSWTCEPFGIAGTSWTPVEGDAPDTIAPILAEINGKRDWYRGIPLNTNLCYSDPAVRHALVCDIADYCAAHPEIDFLHVWLADGVNNHCECEHCTARPSDYYVMLLNELDARLTQKGIDTKIVFIVYVDLLWAPETEAFRNPDRFILMFAPITRTYSETYAVTDREIADAAPMPYEKNALQFPQSSAENLAHLRAWQKVFAGECIDFDYHMVMDPYSDPGSVNAAKMLAEDMRYLSDHGLSGMNSCQIQRCFFPTSLPMLAMAETLWNKSTPFSDIVRAYFTAAFGHDGMKAARYLGTLSELFDPVYQRRDKAIEDEDKARIFARIPAVIDAFLPTVTKNIAAQHTDTAVRKSWEYLLYHAQAYSLYAKACACRADAMYDEAQAVIDALIAYCNRIEEEVHPVFDVHRFIEFMNQFCW